MNFQKWEIRLVVAICLATIVVEALLIKSFVSTVFSNTGHGLHSLLFASSSFLLVSVAFTAVMFVAIRADREREKIIQERLNRWVRL